MRRSSDCTFVLMHSIMLQYMPKEKRDAIAAMMRQAGHTATMAAPVAWLSMEPLAAGDPHATLSLTAWPGGETRRLAHCDYHGRWIKWLASDPVAGPA